MNNVGVNCGSKSDVFCVANIAAQRRAPGAATVGGSSALRGESIGFNALPCARTRCVVMNADKDGVPGAVGDVDPLTQGKEGVITSGHDRFESPRFQRVLKANGCVEGIVLFVSADAFGPGIVGAMASVNDNGVKTDRLLDVAGTNHRIDQLGEVDRRKHRFAATLDDGEAEIELDVVYVNRLRPDFPGHHEAGMLEKAVFVFLSESLKLIKFCHILVGDILSATEAVDFPVFCPDGAWRASKQNRACQKTQAGSGDYARHPRGMGLSCEESHKGCGRGRQPSGLVEKKRKVKRFQERTQWVKWGFQFYKLAQSRNSFAPINWEVPMTTELSEGYQPGDVEIQWFDRWVESGCFRGNENGSKEAYSIVIPPPNVTGILHLGHVLNNTIQDILARRARMEGKDVLWLPGTDHAGIATQSKVEQKLRKDEGKTRRDLGREAFLEKVWDWKEEHGGIIIQQLKRLGCSCDWERERFTMDEEYSRWISKIFVDLFEEGLIYRGKRMVNWCPKSLTALSDEEVIMKPQKSKLYYMRYKVVGTDRWVEIATTRPETLMGDSGVAVNPKDERYGDLVGEKVLRPFPKAEIPVVADEHIDPEFGTGVLKVTPAHDKADFEIGLKNNLEIIDVFNPDGTLNAHAGPDFEGMDRFDAREKAAEKLDEMGQLVKVEDYDNNVGFSERADVPIEPRISMQWFLKYPCVEAAAAAVANDEIHFRPERWKKTYAHWMEGIQDWCISRQLWWGHQIPVWYRKEKADELQGRESLNAETSGGDLHVGIEPPADEENWVRDGDVLDTWFSSWLWPFATMRDCYEGSSPTLEKFYPTTDLVTGPDIIFFWVARMIMAGYRWEGKLPFKNVFFTSIIRDKRGRKMSKQLGNSPDPLDLMADYGADALRFGLMRIAPTGTDVKFDEDQIVEGRNFANKLWNAARYRQMQEGSGEFDLKALSIYSVDILAKLDQLERDMAASYQDYKFNELAQQLYDFFWSQYCDWYLESSKGAFAEGADLAFKASTLATMDLVLKRFLLMLHPFMPHISEELWEKLDCGEEGGEEFLMQTTLAEKATLADLATCEIEAAQARVKAVYEAVGRARNLKAEYGLSATKGVKFIIDPEGGSFDEADVFQTLAGAGEIAVEPGFEAEKGVPTALTGIGNIYLPLEGLIDVEAEKERLGTELAKAEDELKKVNAKLSNENFTSRAPEAVVQEMQDRQKQWQERADELGRMIENLGV